MSKRAIVVLVVSACVLLALLVAGVFVTNANTIDDVAWKGDPVPPCFVNAMLCGGHVLGTDEVGRDLLARLLVGARITLGVSFFAALLTLCLAAALASLARFGGTAVGYIVRRLSIGVSSLPAWPFLIVLAIVSTPTGRVVWMSPATSATLAAVIFWPKMTALLVSTRAPGPIAGRFMRDWASLILVLSTVDFFGYGTMPPTPSWGNILASMEVTIQTGWWDGVFPGLCIFFAVFALRALARYTSTGGATNAIKVPRSEGLDPRVLG